VDISVLQAQVAGLSDTDWDADRHRQERFSVHRRTRSVRLVWTELSSWPRVEARVLPACAPFEEELHRVFVEAVRRLGRPLQLQNAVLARVDPGGSVDPHIDTAPFFSHCHRLHLPLLTDPAALLLVAEDPDSESVSGHCLPEGHLIEVNNRRSHGVKHSGTRPRVHLILDLASHVP
jgi:hypothetical protein